MDALAASSAAARFDRLSGYLAQDPDNASLRAEACDAALACGMHEQANALLAQAPGSPEWDFRRAQARIAQGRLDDARNLLERLHASFGADPAIRHDLAYVHLLSRDGADARALLQDGKGEPAADLFQAHWLRACHFLDDLEPAWRWIERAQASRSLSADAAGVASLVALDLEQTATARALADAALAADPRHPEALVTRGSLALLARDPAQATHFLQRALERNPDDGRTWSALGLASLLGGDLPAARERLERATRDVPDHLPSWQALGWTRMLMDDTQGALAAFGAALACAPQAAEAHGALALASALGGDTTGAQRHAANAERLDRDEATCQLARAVLAGGADRSGVRAQLDRLTSQWRPRP